MSRFAVDTMLGTLAKWLRAFGYDAEYLPHAADDDILRLASEEGRVVLTRDAALAGRAGERGLLVPQGAVEAQLKVIVAKYPRPGSPPLSRCLSCNAMLESAGKELARKGGSVPPGVLAREEEFWLCPRCGKFFWPGSHYDAMMKRFREYFPSGFNG
jgi:uncharacterized protein with PIN domain